MNRNNVFRETLVFFVVVLFFCVSISPCINAVVDDDKDFGEEFVVDSEFAMVRVFPLGVNRFRAKEIVLSVEEVRGFQDCFYNLINSDPFSVETSLLKSEFFGFLEDKGLFLDNQFLYHFFDSSLNRKNVVLHPSQTSDDHNATLLLCSMLGAGWGFIFPPVLFPRPRFVMQWRGFYEDSSVSAIAEMHTGRGVIARGAQVGTSFGFIGVGFAFALPGAPAQFGFVGYSLLTRIQAYRVNWYYANFPPIVTDESPGNGSLGVSLSLSHLSFSLKDFDHDKMSYNVTTFPDIGSGSGVSVSDGSFSVPVHGLEGSTEYHWQVEVSDGFDTTLEDFWFRTEATAPVVSNPFPVDGGVDVSVNLSELSFSLMEPQGDLMDFSVETVPDIGSGSGTGVVNGTYSVSVGGLKSMTDYVWFVNVTDGVFWAHRVFHFQTEVVVFFDPFLEGWQYRKSVTVDHDLVAGDLLGFPVLVSVVDSDLVVHAQFDGDDVLFMDGVGVARKLFHEIEFFNGSSGELVVWVKVPVLSSGVDTVFYLYYGNPVCGSQQVPWKVWDSNYCGVWHLADFYDSTLNSNDGTNHDTDDCLGKISIAKNFTETNNNYIDIGDMPTPSNNIINTATFEAWVNPREGANSGIINKMNNGCEPDRRGYNFHLENYKMEFGVWPGTWYPDESRILAKTNDNIISYNNWQYIAATVDLSIKNIDLYYNGEETPSSISILGTPPTYFYDINLNEWFGAYRGEGFTSFYDGLIDEIRISKICRSPFWILTEYNNQNDPLSFLSFGLEETPP